MKFIHNYGGKLEKRQFARPRRRWEDCIEMGSRLLALGGGGWKKLAQDGA
jgi:hypothetical protein